MNEFTSMYHRFKDLSESTPEKKISNLQLCPEKFPPINDSYIEMKKGSSDIKIQTAANYFNIDHDLTEMESLDTVDGPETSLLGASKEDSGDFLDNLNGMKIKEEGKEISNELKITEEHYFDSNSQNKVVDEFSKSCSEVLENTSEDYLIQPSNRPVTNPFGDYLTHPSNRPFEGDTSQDYVNQQFSRDLQTIREASHLRLYFKKKSDSIAEEGSPRKLAQTLKRADSDTSKKSVDEELLDFKNSVFTIQEVEELFSSWKNRNGEEKSFLEKQVSS